MLPAAGRKEFNALRLRRADQLRRDPEQSLAAKVVGAEIFASLNSVSGQAWHSQATLAKRLSIDLKTVKRAIASMENRYFKVSRTCGGVNVYTPIWEREPVLGAQDGGATGDKNGLGTGDKNGLGTGDKNGPVSLTSNPSNNPASMAAAVAKVPMGGHPCPRAGTRQQESGIRKEPSERLIAQKDDGAIELKAIQLFAALGYDGFDAVSGLHEIDNGAPRLRLFRLIRGGRVTDGDLVAAAAAVRIHRKTYERRSR